MNSFRYVSSSIDYATKTCVDTIIRVNAGILDRKVNKSLADLHQYISYTVYLYAVNDKLNVKGLLFLHFLTEERLQELSFLLTSLTKEIEEDPRSVDYEGRKRQIAHILDNISIPGEYIPLNGTVNAKGGSTHRINVYLKIYSIIVLLSSAFTMIISMIELFDTKGAKVIVPMAGIGISFVVFVLFGIILWLTKLANKEVKKYLKADTPRQVAPQASESH